jgi:high affinity Mn2+ porin
LETGNWKAEVRKGALASIFESRVRNSAWAWIAALPLTVLLSLATIVLGALPVPAQSTLACASPDVLDTAESVAGPVSERQTQPYGSSEQSYFPLLALNSEAVSMPSAAPCSPDGDDSGDDPLLTIFRDPVSDRVWVSGQMNTVTQSDPPFPVKYSGPNSLQSGPQIATGQDSSPDPPVAFRSRFSRPQFQATLTGQGVFPFTAPYTGPNSLDPNGQIKDTFSFDIADSFRPWGGGELYFDGLVWQGYGLSNTEGMAAFPNGEAYRVGTTPPDAVIARAYFRQSVNLGGDSKSASPQAPRRLIFTVGHFAATDVFDQNAYANDSRTQFMNWAFVNNLTWDYPANTLGITNGISAELDWGAWAARAGIFQVSEVANGIRMDWNIAHAWSAAGELQRNFSFAGHHGAVRLLAWKERAHMGSYQEVLSDPKDIAQNGFLEYRTKYGFGINAEQEISKDLGVFMRLGWSNGRTQVWEFTDADRTASLGVSLKGDAWYRPGDTVGIAAVVDGISAVHQQFLARGGLGITVGDGALDYGSERVGEAYYDWNIVKHLWLTLDYQLALNPGYNHARGPANILATRLHWEF